MEARLDFVEGALDCTAVVAIDGHRHTTLFSVGLILLVRWYESKP